jgi:hypothetical protein
MVVEAGIAVDDNDGYTQKKSHQRCPKDKVH